MKRRHCQTKVWDTEEEDVSAPLALKAAIMNKNKSTTKELKMNDLFLQ